MASERKPLELEDVDYKKLYEVLDGQTTFLMKHHYSSKEKKIYRWLKSNKYLLKPYIDPISGKLVHGVVNIS